MIQESLTYLRDSDDVLKTVVIGGLLALLSVLIVPAVTLIGYLMRVVRDSADGGDVAPPIEVDDLVDMTVEGIPGAVVAFVYGLVPAVIALVFVVGGLFAVFAGGSANSGGLLGLGFTGILVGSLLAVVLSLLAAYVIPAALANVAERGSIGAGFDVGTLRPVLLSGTYATAWAMGIGLTIAAGIVVSLISAVTFGLGGIVGVFVQFYALVAAYFIVGRAWAKLNPTVGTEGTETVDRAAA